MNDGYYATEYGESFHDDESCAKGRAGSDTSIMSLTRAVNKGYGPCGHCTSRQTRDIYEKIA